jgi:hypothetical protein
MLAGILASKKNAKMYALTSNNELAYFPINLVN